jgi:hypothetical protein
LVAVESGDGAESRERGARVTVTGQTPELAERNRLRRGLRQACKRPRQRNFDPFIFFVFLCAEAMQFVQ